MLKLIVKKLLEVVIIILFFSFLLLLSIGWSFVLVPDYDKTIERIFKNKICKQKQIEYRDHKHIKIECKE